MKDRIKWFICKVLRFLHLENMIDMKPNITWYLEDRLLIDAEREIIHNRWKLEAELNKQQ